MKNFLSEILDCKKTEIEKRKKNYHLSAGYYNNVKRADGRNFQYALKSKTGYISIIGEIKLMSPSAGVLGRENELGIKVKKYEKAGVNAVSVVTDGQYFGGRLEMICTVRKATGLPVLMKDFIIDPFQIYEGVKAGADAILLIAKILTFSRLSEFVNLAADLGVSPVVEVQTTEELKRALKTKTAIIGVNSRNFNDFSLDVDEACRIIRLIPPDRITIGFSGIKGLREFIKYKQSGAGAVLIGTRLMMEKDPASFIANLKNL